MKKILLVFVALSLLTGCTQSNQHENLAQKFNIIVLNSDFVIDSSIPIKDGDPDPDGDYSSSYHFYIQVAIENISKEDLKELKIVDAELIKSDNSSTKLDPEIHVLYDCDGRRARAEKAVADFSLNSGCANLINLTYSTKQAIYGDESVSFRFKIANEQYSTDFIETKEEMVDFAF